MVGLFFASFLVYVSYQNRLSTRQAPAILDTPRAGTITEKNDKSIKINNSEESEEIVYINDRTTVRELNESGIFVESTQEALQLGKYIIVTMDANDHRQPVWSIDVMLNNIEGS